MLSGSIHTEPGPPDGGRPLLIAPGATAFLLVRRFAPMLIAAVTVTLLATLLGTWASFHLNSAPAPTIVLVLTALFLLALARRMRLTRVASRIVA